MATTPKATWTDTGGGWGGIQVEHEGREYQIDCAFGTDDYDLQDAKVDGVPVRMDDLPVAVLDAMTTAGMEMQAHAAATTTYMGLAAEVAGIEREIAPGGESGIMGHFAARMAELGGEGWRESIDLVPADEADWWRRAYELRREMPEATPQEVFDAV